MTAPLPPDIDSLAQLARAMLRAACSADGAPLPRARELLDRLKQRRSGADAAFLDVAGRRRLSDAELGALALCHAAEGDPMTARLVANAQAPIGGARPLAGFLASIFASLGGDTLALAAGEAVRCGLLCLGDEAAPVAERSLFMPLPVAARFSGRLVLPEGLAWLRFAPTPLPASALAAAEGHAAHLGAGGARLLVIRSACPREAASVAGIVADLLGLEPVDLAPAAVPDSNAGWLDLARALPVLRRAPGPGESCRIDPPQIHDGPMIVLAGLEGMIEAAIPTQEWRIAIPGEAERVQLWEGIGLGPAIAARAAATFRQGAGRIAEIGERIIAPADADAGEWEALIAAIATGTSPLDLLARRSQARVAREDLVIPDELGDALERLVDRVRFRNGLAAGLGPSLRARYRPGVRALFTGESGTGKTLAAHWLSGCTGLPLYRVDLAAMTSKWIGETEKNLSAVLDAAQHADVILFFDEADSLFGARTDVSDSNDRFANAQTNYLLQRIEDFDGVAVMATNSRDRFDPAFVRRLDAILEFPLPDAAARRAIWAAHLGEAHALAPSEIDALSLTVDLPGGHIRNIVLSARVRAMRRGGATALADLHAAAAEEYAKLGRAPPGALQC